MKKYLIIFLTSILLLISSISGCISNVNSVSEDSVSYYFLFFIGIILFIVLIAYLLGGKNTVVQTQKTIQSPIIIQKEKIPTKKEEWTLEEKDDNIKKKEENITIKKEKIEETRLNEKNINNLQNITKIKFCFDCGEKLKYNPKFCYKCGIKLR